MKNYLENNPHADLFREIGEVAAKKGFECYVIGGYVRDLLLGVHNDDIDFVVVGNGLEMAREVGDHFKSSKVSLYESYGTAKVDVNGLELEFVGARKEFYHRESRNPIVEDGTLADDMARRDFTINDMAISVNKDNFGELIDPYGGKADLDRGTVRCVSEPTDRFNEDPLRMLRCIRFATRFGFVIDKATFCGMKLTAHRIKIITRERIIEELDKMMMTKQPSIAINYLNETGLLKMIIPELCSLMGRDGKGADHNMKHKDNFEHSLKVLDAVAAKSDKLYLRWAALLHDIGKVKTKKYTKEEGWTFRNHETVGAKMVKTMFTRLGMPLDERLDFVMKMVRMHMRPMTLCDNGVTDSAVRRILFDAGEDIDDLMILCNADITSANKVKSALYRQNYEDLVVRMAELEESDHLRNFQPPVDGNEIMSVFGLTPSKEVGMIKSFIKEAILDGVVPNEHDAALECIKKEFGYLIVTDDGDFDVRMSEFLDVDEYIVSTAHSKATLVYDKIQEIWTISRLAVKKGYRQRHFAKNLLEKCIDVARNVNDREIRIVMEDSTPDFFVEYIKRNYSISQ